MLVSIEEAPRKTGAGLLFGNSLCFYLNVSKILSPNLAGRIVRGAEYLFIEKIDG